MINGCKIITVRCRFCGRLRKYDFNVFEAMSKDKVEYRCKCGEVNVLVSKGKDNDIGFEVGCFNCGDRHYHNFKLKEIIEDNNMVYCSHGGNLFSIESKKIANQIPLEGQANIGNEDKEIHGEDYFNNFNILTKALKKIYDLNKKHKIDCDCGNAKINVELFADRIELKCENCHSVKLIFTETEEDLSILLKKDKIILKERNISCIDSIKEKNKDIKK